MRLIPSSALVPSQVERSCKHRCQEDLQSTTRYVTWSLHTRNTRGLRSILAKVRE